MAADQIHCPWPHINGLPPELLGLIFDEFCNTVAEDGVNPAVWKEMLPLVAVCRMWRTHALRHVYKWAFVECHSELSSDTDSDDGGTPDDQQHQWLTNADLFLSLNKTLLARNVILYMEAELSLAQFMQQAVDILAVGKAPWSEVRSLHISINSDIDDSENVDSSSAEGEQWRASLKDAADAMARCLPMLGKVRIFAHLSQQKSAATRSFSNRLLSRVGGRLNSLTTFVPVNIQIPAFTPRLTQLRMTFDHRGACYIPRVFAQSLQSLVIVNAPRVFPWERFASDASPRKVVFSNLREFSAYFQSSELDEETWAAGSASSAEIQVHMPCLRELRVELAPVGFLEALRRRVPEQLARLHIAGPLELIKSALCLDIKKVDVLVVRLMMLRRRHKSMFYRATEAMFGEQALCKRPYCTLDSMPFELDFGRVQWRHLRQLSLDFPTELDMLGRCIHGLPCLEQVCASALTFANVGAADIVDSLPPSYQMPAPFDSQIEMLSMGTKYPSLMLQYGLLILTKIILRIPALKKLYLEDSYVDLVRQLDHSHPALRRLRQVMILPEDMMQICEKHG
ncbi:hypothetical protein LPJ61_003784 [Coemansia biformis]|uniref:F-box domain-containing protein n=1 Tax=Coemansia biformis TaxID=1286918 RepID=A0A9W7YCC8_9FUNG|nr:hypothetical protein LPJ61_003784 [Coemansia biformis]